VHRLADKAHPPRPVEVRYPGYYAAGRAVVTLKNFGIKSFEEAHTHSGGVTGSKPRLICSTQLVTRMNLSDVHCALIQFSDPVTLTHLASAGHARRR